MATFTIRNDSELYTVTVANISFSSDPAIFHRANLSSLGGPSNTSNSSVNLSYSMLPLTTVNFSVIYDLNTLTVGTYSGTIVVTVNLASGTQTLTATNIISVPSLTGVGQYVETGYTTPFVFSAGGFVDGFGPSGPRSANSGGVASGSLPGDYE
jgi:hypothetical protein